MQDELTTSSNSAKWQLLLMIAMVIGVIVAGFLVFPRTADERDALLSRIGTTNHGELIKTPALLPLLNLEDPQGEQWIFEAQKPQWRLLILGEENCLEACAEMLFMTRQVHKRLGKYAQRFQRIYLSTGQPLDNSLVRPFQEEHPYLKVLFVERSELHAWLQKMQIENKYGIALLVDPRGLAMMRYGLEHTGGKMIEDINHLMKYSAN